MGETHFYRHWAEDFARLKTLPSIDVHGYCSVSIGGTVERMLKEIDRLRSLPMPSEPLQVGAAVTIRGSGTEGRVTDVKDNGDAQVFYFNRAMQREEENWFSPAVLLRTPPPITTRKE